MDWIRTLDFSDQIIEGVSNEVTVVVTFTIFFAGFSIFLLWKNQDLRLIPIHPAVLARIQGFRREQNLLDESALNRRLDEFRAQNREECVCPVCYGRATYAVLTNCGHVFCCACMIGYWRHTRSIISPIDCPICRQIVSLLMPVDWADDTNGNEDHQEVESRCQADLDDYNRRFSSNRSWIDYFWDLPVVLPYIMHDMFEVIRNGPGHGVLILIRLRIVAIFIIFIAYLLSPLDIIPESVFGIFGFIDDLAMLILLSVYVVHLMRGFFANRAEEVHPNAPEFDVDDVVQPEFN